MKFWRERERENKEQVLAPLCGQVRVLVVGDSGVGKTSLVHLINKGSSIARPSQTIGCTVGVKHITYGSPSSSSNSIQGDSERDFFVELWDVSGHERYKDCRSLFYSQINGVIFVHDLSQRRTKTSLQKWASEVAATGTFSAPLPSGGPGGLPVPYIVVGNKADIAAKQGTKGSSGNLVDAARHWVEKQGLLPSSSEDLPLFESFPGNGGLIAILACECIPNLKSRFRVNVVGAITNCPRMCKQKWRDNHMKGYPLEDVNSALGSTTEIQSILEPELSEVPLMASITEGDEIQSSDPLAVTWEQRLCVEMKKICWKKLHDLDVDSRRRNVTEEQQEEELIPPQSSRTVNSLKSLESKLMRAMNAGFKELNKKIDKKCNLLNRRVTDIELCVNGALNKSKGKDVSVDGEMETEFEKEASVDGEMETGFEREASVDGEMGTEFEKEASVDGEMGTEFEKEGNEANEMADKEDEVAIGEDDDEIEAIEDSAGNEVERTDDELTGEEDEAATCSEADEMETENINESQPCDKMLKRTRKVSQYCKPPYTEGKKRKKKSEPAK